MFTLVVDYSAINYLNISDAEHLFLALRDKCLITTDMEYKNYISVALVWDYINTHVTFFMPNYITTELNKFQHGIPSAPKNSPHIHVKLLYSAKIQYAHDPDSYLCLQEKGVAIIQKILGTFIY